MVLLRVQASLRWIEPDGFSFGKSILAKKEKMRASRRIGCVPPRTQRSGPSKARERGRASPNRRVCERSTVPPVWKTVPASDNVERAPFVDPGPALSPKSGTNSSPIGDTRQAVCRVFFFSILRRDTNSDLLHRVGEGAAGAIIAVFTSAFAIPRRLELMGQLLERFVKLRRRLFG